MTKKISVVRHTEPLFALLVLILFVCLAGWFLYTVFATSWMFGLLLVGIFVGIPLILSSPSWTAYLWNKFIANEEEYYD